MWPAEYIELQHIDKLLICGICYEYIDTSVITLCSHNYCSLCIRKYLHYKSQCPTCFTETFEKDLRKNKVLDDVIAYFSQIKDKLKRCLQIQILQNSIDNSVSYKPKLIDNETNNEDLIKCENKMISIDVISKNNLTPCTSIPRDLSSPSTSGRTRIPLIFTPKSSKRPIVSKMEDTKVVICPVCKVSISELKINRHLDDCLKREDIQDKPSTNESKRKPLPKLVYTLMKDSVLKKKLKELGLSTQGDRKALEARMQRYIVLYNAECDKPNPRSISELLKRCEDEENIEKKNNVTSSFMNRLHVNRNTEQNVIEDERKKYLERHKDSFDNLIKNMKCKNTSTKSPTRRSILNESVKIKENLPLERQASAEDATDSMDEQKSNEYPPLNYNDVYIRDTDSDESLCPLQTYSCTDSMKFVNSEMSICDDDEIIQKSPLKRGKKTNVKNNSPVKNKKKYINFSSTSSNISLLPNEDAESTNETRFHEALSSNDAKDRSTTPQNNVPFVRRQKVNQKGESKRLIKQEMTEDEKKEISSDMYTFDSNNCKSNYGKTYTEELLNSSKPNFTNPEKENISSSPELGGTRAVRKRSRDCMQSENKSIVSTKKRIKKTSKLCLSETDDSNNEESCASVLHDNENGRTRTQLRLRKQDLNIPIEEDIPVLRKSSRTRCKNNILEKI